VVTLRLIDIISNKGNKLVIEAALKRDDSFDDIKYYRGGGIDHFQVKYAYSEFQFNTSQFFYTSQKNDLALSRLFSSWKAYKLKEPEYIHRLHIFTPKKIEKNDSLVTQVGSNEFSERGGECFQINQNDPKIVNCINSCDNSDEFKEFLDSLVIETNQPLDGIHPEISIDGIIIDKITQLLGFDTPPYKKDSITVFNQLLRCSDSHYYGKELDKIFLLKQLGINENRGSISHTISMDHTFLNPRNYQKFLTENIQISSLIGVIGKPGAGKTWLLTKWKENFEKKYKVKPISFYCHIEVVGDRDLRKRISLQQLMQDIIYQIMTFYPEIRSENEQRIYSNDKAKFKETLLRLGAHAHNLGLTIPIIIDGLDHIARIKKNHHLKIEEGDDIIKFLRNLDIPMGICLIFGSQPISKIDALKGRSKILPLEGFSYSNARKYLKNNLTDSELTEEHVKIIFQKSDGIPLILKYITESVKTKILTLDGLAKGFPLTHGDIEKYYNWIWKGFRHELVIQYARLLSILDFPIRSEDLNRIISKERIAFQQPQKYINQLFPVIVFQDNKIEIFHDSFKRYVLNQEDYTPEMKVSYNDLVFEKFSAELIYNDDKILSIFKHGFLAKQYSKIITLLDEKLLDWLYEIQISFTEIQDILEIGLKSCFKSGKLAAIVRFVLLLSYTFERNQNLDIDRISEYLALQGQDESIKRIIHNGNMHYFGAESSIGVVYQAIKNNIKIPNNEIDIKFESERIYYNNLELYIKFLKVLITSKGISKAIDDLNHRQTDYELRHLIIKEICEIAKGQIKKIDISKRDSEIGIYYDFLNNPSKLDSHIEKYILNGTVSSIWHIVIEANYPIADKIEVFYPNIPHRNEDTYNFDYSDLLKLHNTTILLSHTKEFDKLNKIENYLDSLPKTALSILAKLSFIVGKVKGVYDIVDQINMIKLFEGLIDFIYHSYDRSITNGYINYLNPNFVSFSKIMIESGLKVYFGCNKRLTFVDFINLATPLKRYVSGLSPIQASIILVENSKDDLLKTDVINFLENVEFLEQGPEESIKRYLEKAILFAKFNETSKSKSYYQKAIRLSMSYGFHKDPIYFELLESIKYLFNSKNKLAQKYCDLIKFEHCLEIVTDGDGLSYFRRKCVDNIIEQNPTLGLRLLENNKFNDLQVLVYRSLIRKLTNTSIMKRYNLIKQVAPFIKFKWNGLELELDLLEESIHKGDEVSTSKIIGMMNESINKYKAFKHVIDPDIDRRYHALVSSVSSKNNILDSRNSAEFKKSQIQCKSKKTKNELVGYLITSLRKGNKEETLLSDEEFRYSLILYMHNFEKEEISLLIDYMLRFKPLLSDKIINYLCLKYLSYKDSNSYKILSIFERNGGWSIYDIEGQELNTTILAKLYSKDKGILGKILKSYIKSYSKGKLTVLVKFLTMIGLIRQAIRVYEECYKIFLILFREYDLLKVDPSWFKFTATRVNHNKILEKLYTRHYYMI